MTKMNMYAQLLINEAKKRGISVEEIDCRFNLFALSNKGRKIMCRESLTELTSAYTMTICSNKWLTLKYLRENGLSVPEQSLFEDLSQALRFMHDTGGAVVVKPLNGEQGAGITVNVGCEDDLEKAVARAKCFDSDVLLEQFIEGRDIRVIVINYRFVAAIERVPAAVIGDGASTIKELIGRRNRVLAEATDAESQIPADTSTIALLKEQGYNYEERPAQGLKIKVCRLANFHSGGTIEDVTEKVSTKLRTVSEEAAKVLNIPVVGLDLLSPDPGGEEYVFIEANERPGLANHEPQPTAERFIDYLFPETAH